MWSIAGVQLLSRSRLTGLPRSKKRTPPGGRWKARTGDPRASHPDAGLFRLFDLFGIRAPQKGANSDDVNGLEHRSPSPLNNFHTYGG
jgi:hypothetical protein